MSVAVSRKYGDGMQPYLLFPSVDALHLSGLLTVHITSTLQDIIEEVVTEELPALHLLCLEGSGDDDNHDNDDNEIDYEYDSFFRYQTIGIHRSIPLLT